MIDYITLLKKNNLKATIQRTAILKSIDRAGHINIDDICEKVRETHPTLSLATIYKNIRLMQKNSVIIEVPINGQKAKYELKKNDHIHLICQSCGKIKDRNMSQKTKEALIIENFKINNSQINLYGVCEKCQKR